MQVTTKEATAIWRSPDGKRTIWSVKLDADGKEYQLKTYSEEISQVGFTGEVESYDDKRGEKFVKQPQKQGGYAGGARSGKDQKIISAQWALGQALKVYGVQLATADDKSYAKIMTVVEQLGGELFNMAQRISGGTQVSQEDKVADVDTDKPLTVADLQL